jgi:hypothetical protein
MRYAHTPPAEAGYYWLKEGDEEEIVEVWTDPAAPGGKSEIYFVHRCGSGEAREAGALTQALWAGPISAPQPAVDQGVLVAGEEAHELEGSAK